MAFPPPQMKPHRPLSRTRRREWFLMLGILALVIFLSTWETHLYELTQKFPLANSILVLGVININILLIILFLFLVFRNILKLALERQRGVPGSRLRTKLVITFVGLSLVPTLLLYFVSAGFITNSIENWFNAQIEVSLQGSLEVAQTYYQNQSANALYYADQLSRIIKEEKLLNEGNLDKLADLVLKKQQEYNLGMVEVFSATHEELVRASNPQVPAGEFTDPESDHIHDALNGQRFSRITPIGQADLIRGIVPIYSNWKPADAVGAVVVNYYVPHSLVSKMQEISSSFEQYKNTQLLKGRIKKGYVVFLGLIALVITFLATWFGFRLARGITGPIQELALATDRVAGGDLEVRLDLQSNDEIGLLVQAFNKMTADLRQGQQELRQANRDLQSSNTELDQRRRYMEVVLKNVTAGVISVDNQGCLTTVNKSAEKLLRIKTSKVLGRDYREVVNVELLPMIKDILQELKESGKDSIRRQITLPLPDSKLTLLVNVTTLRDETGEFMGTVAVFDDLTHLIKAQRMAAWREVARRIAHEIKNPLTPIQLSAQRLRRRYLERFADDDKVFDDCTSLIISEVDTLKNLVNEFSTFARMPTSHPTPNDINEILSEALLLFQENHKEIEFVFHPEPGVPVFNLDRDQIKRAVINLLDNAVGAIEKDGTIEIEAGYNPTLQVVTFSVADTGCGIPPEDKPRLFEPYFSTKKSGTGLGLAIVASIVSDHNGYIRVKDNHPRGTRFIVELPTGGSTNHV